MVDCSKVCCTVSTVGVLSIIDMGHRDRDSLFGGFDVHAAARGGRA